MRRHLNNYLSTITTTTVAEGDLALDVASAAGLPILAAGEWVLLTLTDSLTAPTKTEIIKVTGISSVTLTIERAQEGTAASAFASGDIIECRATAASFDKVEGAEIKRYRETVALTTSAIDRASGGILYYTMTANTTFTLALNEGESLTLHLYGGDTYSATWPTATGVGVSLPSPPTAADVYQFWKIGTTLYRAYVGSET